MNRMIPVDFACNDPDSGLFAGRVGNAEIDGNEIERFGEVAFTEMEDCRFRIHRKVFAFESRKEWVGNWCWNRYWMPVKEANRLVEHLRKNGWQCTTGETRFYERFNTDAPANTDPTSPPSHRAP